MKYGIYYAYWEDKWEADYFKYIEKVAKLGFDFLEIACTPINGYSKQTLKDFRQAAKDNGIFLTAGHGPNADQNLASPDAAVRKNAKKFFTTLLRNLEILDIHSIGGGIYSYWPVDYSKPIDKKGDWARSVKGVREMGKVAEDIKVWRELEPGITEAKMDADAKAALEAKIAASGMEILAGAARDGYLLPPPCYARKLIDNALDACGGAVVDKHAVAELKRRMDAAKSILWIFDNCGEAVFDRLLMEPYRAKLTLAVRGRPAFNDLTRAELAASGYPADFAAGGVVSNDDGLPGVVDATCGAAFRAAFQKADLVVAKGQANFETMNERTDKPIAVLFLAKCPVVCRTIGAEPKTIQILHNKKQR